jgi:hypothetical protein
MKRKYRLMLPVEIDGVVHEYGEVVELDLETAAAYAHALIAVEEGESNGGHD